MSFIFPIFLLFFASMCIGSFLNVVILRAISGESIVLPPSKCPKCHEKIKWYDNIPIFSYLFLRGKCRFCKEHISIQYPIVEFVTGVIFMIILFKFQLSLKSLFLLVLASLAIVISVTDIKERAAYNVHTISFAVVALIYNLISHNIVNSIIGLVLAALVMEIVAKVGYKLCIGNEGKQTDLEGAESVQTRAFGEGDTYIAAGIGALLGIKMFLIVLILSIFFQALLIFPSFIKTIWLKKEERLAITLILFLLITALYKSLDYKLELNTIITFMFIILIIALGTYSCVKLLKISKTQTTLTALPFGPSLLIATFLMIFCGKEIFEILTKLF